MVWNEIFGMQFQNDFIDSKCLKTTVQIWLFLVFILKNFKLKSTYDQLIQLHSGFYVHKFELRI
jgi:hypothetical protein